jgi:hypothetical protein
MIAIAASLSVLSIAACEDPLAPFLGITATSTTVNMHFHTATIPARDINDPPSGGITITTSTAGNPAHTHAVTLTALQLQDLQQDMAVVSLPTDTGSASVGPQHTHAFLFER